MKKSVLMLLLVTGVFMRSQSQELFSYTEPASNMAARTLGFRLNTTLMKDEEENSNNLHLLPEVMFGVSKKWMIHLEGFASDRDKKLQMEGGSLYIKYRFYSTDEVHSHFRMAAFSRLSFNNSDIHQHAIDLTGHNSGYELGWVGTKLNHKLAVSGSISLAHAFDNRSAAGYKFYDGYRDAVNYTVSVGRLMLPKKYKDYNQTNLNLMVELMGQTNVNLGNSYLDCGPVLQLIFMSKMRLDCSYRFPVYDQLHRSATRGAFVRFEYNIFNAFR